MKIDIYFAINLVNKIKITKFLENINWRICHVTKRKMKIPLLLKNNHIQILEGNIRSPNHSLLLQYGEKLILEFNCLIINNSIQVNIQLSNYLQTKFREWVTESVWFSTVTEGKI